MHIVKRNMYSSDTTRRLVFCAARDYFTTMQSKAVLQVLLIVAALLGFAAYTFVHGSDACLIAGS
jgi:hypothetical protein